MPLLTGNWDININGTQGKFNLINVGADGLVSGNITADAFEGIAIDFMGYWNEVAQSIFFETVRQMIIPGGPVEPRSNDHRAQFFGYLFNSQVRPAVGADIKWVLCGHVSTSAAAPFPGLPINSRRIKFGWYAEINQVM